MYVTGKVRICGLYYICDLLCVVPVLAKAEIGFRLAVGRW